MIGKTTEKCGNAEQRHLKCSLSSFNAILYLLAQCYFIKLQLIGTQL